MHTRSKRSQLTVIVLLVLALGTVGSAYAYATGSTISWLDRDRITTTFSDHTVSEDGTLTMQMTITNPTGRPIRLLSVPSDLVVYHGDPPLTEASQLTVPRTVTFPKVTVEPGSERTVTVRLQVKPGRAAALRQALDEGNTTLSGRLYMQMNDRTDIRYLEQ